MYAALAPEHREFFTKNRYIEFEDVITDADLVQEHIDQVLGKRIQKIIDTRTPKELFIAGRDLFREDPVIRKISLNRHLAQIASLLFDTTPVRIAYDQSLRTTTLTGSPFLHPFTLAQGSCFQPILCGAIVRLLSDLHPPALLLRLREERRFRDDGRRHDLRGLPRSLPGTAPGRTFHHRLHPRGE